MTEELRALFARYKQTGDVEARNKIVEQHLYVAEILAKTIMITISVLMDLFTLIVHFTQVLDRCVMFTVLSEPDIQEQTALHSLIRTASDRLVI